VIDPVLERRYADCRELMELWRRFHDYFKIAVAGKGITPEKEHEFINIKSRIAMLHDSFMECLEHDQNIGQNILSIVMRSITLRHIHRMSAAEIKKIELEWHESYLLLNETIGVLEDKRNQLADIKPSQYYRRLYIKKALDEVKKFVASWVFKAIVAIAVVMIGSFFFIQMGGVDKLAEYPMTRNLILRFEDLIRIVAKEYPYRDLSVFTRMDRLPPEFVEIKGVADPKDPNYSPDRAMRIVSQKIGGGPNDFSQDLKQATEVRVERYSPGYAFGGTECVTWLFRMPSTELAQSIEKKYQTWKNSLPPNAPPPDWTFFRKANVVGIAIGGDNIGRVRGWVREQYLHIRRKR